MASPIIRFIQTYSFDPVDLAAIAPDRTGAVKQSWVKCPGKPCIIISIGGEICALDISTGAVLLCFRVGRVTTSLDDHCMIGYLHNMTLVPVYAYWVCGERVPYERRSIIDLSLIGRLEDAVAGHPQWSITPLGRQTTRHRGSAVYLSHDEDDVIRTFLVYNPVVKRIIRVSNHQIYGRLFDVYRCEEDKKRLLVKDIIESTKLLKYGNLPFNLWVYYDPRVHQWIPSKCHQTRM